MEKHWKVWLHTKISYALRVSWFWSKIVNDLRGCYDIDQRLFGQVQGHFRICPKVFQNEKHSKVLLHTKIAYHQRVCHDYEPRSLGQVPGHCEEKYKMRVKSISFLLRIIGSSYLLLMTWEGVMILTKGYLGKFKVIRKNAICVSSLYFFYEKHWTFLLHWI